MPSRAAIIGGLYAAFAARLGPCPRSAAPPFERALAVILGGNANPRGAEQAIAALKAAGPLSPALLRGLPEARLAELIRPAGRLRTTLPRLRRFVEFLEHEGVERMTDLRERNFFDLRESLLSVRGIGPGTADALLCEALELPAFIVDSAAVRMFARHGLVLPEEVDADEIQELVRSALADEAKDYAEFHALIDRAAKKWCLRSAPRCAECPGRAFLPDPERLPQ